MHDNFERVLDDVEKEGSIYDLENEIIGFSVIMEDLELLIKRNDLFEGFTPEELSETIRALCTVYKLKWDNVWDIYQKVLVNRFNEGNVVYGLEEVIEQQRDEIDKLKEENRKLKSKRKKSS